ncbi:MAG: protein nirF [Rhodospirillaceae bacterium]|nr:protein nirF [Rhodospirillaceae bacterium]
MGGSISPIVRITLLALVALAAYVASPRAAELRGSGDLGIIVERATGRVQVIETTNRTRLATVEGLGDLSHASAVFSRDQRYAYVFGRDGGLTKVDVLDPKIVGRVIQGGNSIGGAISQDGKLVAVSNYKPGGVKVFNSDTLELVADIPAVDADGVRSKTVGLVDAPGQRFVFSLYDAGEIWIADFSAGSTPKITKFPGIGKLPYDALVTDDGRYYIAGLFGEDGMAMLDLWSPEKGVTRILDGYGKGEKKLPVYKMPHLEGWAKAGDHIYLPAIGRHELLIVDPSNWKEVGRIQVHGQPVFAVARPDGRQVWVNFAHPNNDTVQVIDVPSQKIIHQFAPGKAILHLEFTPRGEQVWISVRDVGKVEVYDTETFAKITELPADKPSGIFLSARAHRTGL